MGGGVNTDNAKSYLDAGASHVIVTSFVFREGGLDEGRLKELVSSLCVHMTPSLEGAGERPLCPHGSLPLAPSTVTTHSCHYRSMT